MYGKIKSQIIKNKIRKCPWKNRKYIDDLITIERYALGERFGWVTGYIIQGLKASYPHEFEIIYQEVNPKGFKKMKEWEQEEAERQRKEEEEYVKREKAELKNLKQEWAKAGGKT